MRRKGRLPELLSPAGSFECLIAAVAAGADAVYVGGTRFGARAFAKNFDTGELSRAVSYCHLHGVKLYVTVNTLVEDKEMADVVAYATELWRIGVDAIIISDLGALAEIRRVLPDMELHASTQMSVHNTPGAEAAFRLGCTRVVPARELSLENIKSIVESSPTEVEIFLHGALCVCHSGQCLFSSLVGGRSGNRGECAQPCRLPYKTAHGTGYPLSLKDLSLADHIPQIIDSGVSSLKIEGRMKAPFYVYTVTSVYRRLLDEGRSANGEERELLRRAFSREGFTDGYLTGRLDGPMTGIRSEENKREGREENDKKFEIIRHGVRAKVSIRLGAPAVMTLFDGVRSVSVEGDVATEARNSPLSPEAVKGRLSKMGNTFLSLDVNDIELELDGGVNLSPASLNGLRRAASERFEDFTREVPERCMAYSYDYKSMSDGNERPIGSSLDYSYNGDTEVTDSGCTSGCDITEHKASPELESTGANVDNSLGQKSSFGRGGEGHIISAEFFSAESYLDAMMANSELLEKIKFRFVPLFSSDEAILSAGGVSLPPIITDSEISEVEARLEEVKKLGIMYALVNNIGHISLVGRFGFVPFGGFRLNIFNRMTAAVYRGLGVQLSVISPELTLPQARDVLGGVITYGRIPLMLTERCFIKENFGCENCGSAALADRRGQLFPMLREWGHRNQIVNSAVTYMGDKSAELSKYEITHRHLIFTVESGDEIVSALSAYTSGRSIDFADVRRVGKRSSDAQKSTTEKPKASLSQKNDASAHSANSLGKGGFSSGYGKTEMEEDGYQLRGGKGKSNREIYPQKSRANKSGKESYQSKGRGVGSKYKGGSTVGKKYPTGRNC